MKPQHSAVVSIDGTYYQCHHAHRSSETAEVCRQRILSAQLAGRGLPAGVVLKPVPRSQARVYEAMDRRIRRRREWDALSPEEQVAVADWAEAVTQENPRWFQRVRAWLTTPRRVG
jgi:hypothetical protein